VQESAFLVGMIGLAAFIPVFLLTLPAGETADRYDRKKVLLICLTGEIATVLTLAIASWKGWASVPMLLGVGFVFGASRAFFAPANTALGPMLVPRPLLPRAIAWNSLAWQTASIAGPAAGGLLVAISPAHAYFTTFGLYLIAGLAVFLIRKNAKPVINPGSRWALMKEGLAYVWRQKIVFGAISLDLFAVLLGGATALLPVFARDILHVGPQGFGVLRSGPAIGATVVALALAANPIRKHAGLFMFGGVATFGAATLVFAVSKQLWLSVAALAVLGGADMLSVYIRQTLVQLVTPDAMRGRVAAVSSVFIGASNELGEFESGVVARFLGPVGAAIFGGVGALVVTALWAKLFPALRKADRLE
jgi:MFS family permease